MPQAVGHKLEERVGHLEAPSAELEDLVYQRTNDLNDRVAQIAQDMAHGEVDVHTREKAILEFLREMLTADLKMRRLGVRLLAIGIVLALTGNFLGLAA